MAATARGRVFALRLYRFGALALIAWLVRSHHLASSVAPPTALREIVEYFPDAINLKQSETANGGTDVFDANGERLGSVVMTMPLCKNVIGYSGTTDTLVAMDDNGRVLGVKIRSSEDTQRYVDEVSMDRLFLKSWDGMRMKKAAALDLERAGIDVVTGATQTSRAVARGIGRRLSLAAGEPAPVHKIKFGRRDAGLLAVLIAALLLTFTRLRGLRWPRRLLQAVVIGYVGFFTGDLVAIKLLAGWTKSGVPWDLAPGMALIVGAALLLPWAAKSPLYCQSICPHGAAQEWMFWLTRGKLRVRLPAWVTGILRVIPFLLLAATLVITMRNLNVDLSKIEPFDAYNFFLGSTSWAALILAVSGLIASMFVPMAYCKFGCPTGALLEFGRSLGAQDRFGKRDVAAALMVGLALVLY